MMRGNWDDEEQALTGHNGWARDLFYLVVFSQDIYCGGYSGEDPPLPIPNREVKLAIADGTAPPGGRVGSCHALIKSFETSVSELFLCVAACSNPLGQCPRPLKGYFGPARAGRFATLR